jgi:hypothetical protein
MRAMRTALMLVLGGALATAGCTKEQAKPAATPPAPGTTEWKIQNAMSSGPEYVVTGAKLVELVANDTATPLLRAGTNDWTCFTDDPRTPANDPTCADDEAMKYVEAYLAHQPPRLSGMALIYALQGSQMASIADPYKVTPDSGQAWIDIGPAVLIAMPDARAYRGLPSTPTPGKPWVMFAGTSYALLVVPAAAPARATPGPASPARQ